MNINSTPVFKDQPADRSWSFEKKISESSHEEPSKEPLQESPPTLSKTSFNFRLCFLLNCVIDRYSNCFSFFSTVNCVPKAVDVLAYKNKESKRIFVDSTDRKMKMYHNLYVIIMFCFIFLFYQFTVYSL